MPGNAIFLSIRPQYANKIFEGTKTVELRRVRPKYVMPGALVLVYVSSPVQSLVGAFKVDRVIEQSLPELWRSVYEEAGVTRQEFDTYFEGASVGIGIFFSKIWRFPEPIELQELQNTLNFHPPQGFRYVTASELASPQLSRLVRDKVDNMQPSFYGEFSSGDRE